MLQFTNLPNGDMQITADSSDALLFEVMKQFGQGMVVVPRSYVPRAAFTNRQRLVVTSKENAAKLVNAAYQVYEISPITIKVIARDADSFFVAMQEVHEKGYVFQTGSATLTFGSYSAVSRLQDAVPSADETPVSDTVPNFDMSVAMSFNSKEELIAYCEQFGIEVDKRKTLTTIQNWLQAKSLEGN